MANVILPPQELSPAPNPPPADVAGSGLSDGATPAAPGNPGDQPVVPPDIGGIDVPPEAPPPPASEPPPTEDGPPGFFNPGKMLLDTERAHRAASDQNMTDWSHDPLQLATNQHLIDVHFNKKKREIAEARNGLDAYLADWLGTPQPNGQLRTERPPLPIWTSLSYDQQRAVDGFLARNAWMSPHTADRVIAAERNGRAASSQPANVGPTVALSAEGLLIDVSDPQQNRRQGLNAEERYLEERQKREPMARFFRNVRLYIPGSPDYMVADVLITGGGVMHAQIVETKSGDAILSEAQVKVLAEAVKTGNVYFVREKISESESPKDPRPDSRRTLAEQGIEPIVAVIGGDQATMKRQFRNFGVEYIPGGGGRIGRISAPVIPE